MNKLGEYYRKGIAVKKDLQKAFEYYQKSSDEPEFTLCKWSKYNLAKYFYEDGDLTIGIEKDIIKAIELLDDVANDIIEASKELIYIYYRKYLEKNDEYYLRKIQYYKALCENHKDYNNYVKLEIENVLKDIKDKSDKIEIP